MTRVLGVSGVRFLLAGVLALAVAACFVGRAEAAPGASVVAGDRALTLKWGAVKGAAGYRVSWRGRVLKGGKPTMAWSKKWLGLKVLSSSVLSYKVTGLANGAQYQLRLESKAKTKKSLWDVKSTLVGSPKAPVPAATVPGAPTGVSGVMGDASVVVSWLAPSSDGGSAITGYTVTASGGVSPVAKQCAASPCTVTGLTKGAAYTFTVVATNARGNSVASAASGAVTPATWPGPPTSVVGYASNNSVQVFWSAPANDGGSRITGYTATASGDGSHRCSTSGARTCVVFNLSTDLAYTFTVVATNANGSSGASAESLPVVPGSCFLGYSCRVSAPRPPLDPRS